MMIEEFFQHLSIRTIGTLVVALLAIRFITRWIIKEQKIKALGGHCPKVKYYIPFGIDMVIRAVRNTMNHRNLEAWEHFFRKDGSRTNSYTADTNNYTAEAQLINIRAIFTADPENIKAILATQFSDYGKGLPFHEDFKDFLGDSIFTTDGDQWHGSRQLIRPQFIKDRVSDLACFEKHVQILITAIANGGVKGAPGVEGDGIGRGKEVDVSDLFFRYTLDAATEFLLGRSVNSLEIVEQDFAIAFSEVQRVQNIISRAGPANGLIPRKSFYKGLKVINEFVNPFIDEALLLSPEELAGKTKSEEGYTFLHALASFTRDRKVLRDQLVAVLLAGRDTTASTLSWTFYELARHPEVVQKLREEILETVGLNRPPTYNDLKNMKYLQNTMHETLRLYPSVPFNVRLALKDTTLPSGGGPGPNHLSPIGVLANTPIGYSTLVMQRRADLYPPHLLSPTPSDPNRLIPFDHLTFNPSRWFTWQPKPWTYIPFNGGPRICIGQQFALTEMAYTIVRVLQKFERVEGFMEGVDGGKPKLKAEIVLQPGDGVRVGFWERKGREGEKVV